jgi:hypothetical protein
MGNFYLSTHFADEKSPLEPGPTPPPPLEVRIGANQLFNSLIMNKIIKTPAVEIVNKDAPFCPVLASFPPLLVE